VGLPKDAMFVFHWRRGVDLRQLGICLRDGILKIPEITCGIDGGWQWERVVAWWLMSVPELQVARHFPDASKTRGGSAKEHLKFLIGKGEDCPQRKQLLHFHHYWNNADHAGALDELTDQARYWPLDESAEVPEKYVFFFCFFFGEFRAPIRISPRRDRAWRRHQGVTFTSASGYQPPTHLY
jgi:hypothetical protein